MRLIQLAGPAGRRIAVVEEPHLRLVDGCSSIYELAWMALQDNVSLTEIVNRRLSGTLLDYDPIYEGRSDWSVLPSADFPIEPARCLVSGTGLTHKGLARKNRDAMHADAQDVSDSTRMYMSGLEGGRPAVGGIRVAPGVVLQGHWDRASGAQ